jgi:hypothetical protein
MDWDASGLIPIYSLDWNTDFKCGLCKLGANPKYAGPLVTQLIDPDPNLSCPICRETFSDATIGMHIITCDHNLIKCPNCVANVKLVELNEHVMMNCEQLPCKKCAFKGTREQLEIHDNKHDLILRVFAEWPAMIMKIHDNAAMTRFDLLRQALYCLDNLVGTEDRSLYEEMLHLSE